MAEEPEDNLPPEGEGAQAAAEEQAAIEGDQDGSQDSPRTSSDVEDLAREMGWAPQDQWRGEPTAWKDARAFLKNTVDINRTLSKDVRGLKDEVSRMSRTSAKIAERAIAEERGRLEQRFAEATEAGDTQAAWQAAQDLQRVHDEPAADPLAEFRERNAWYDTDPEARAVAYAVGEMHKGKPATEVMRLAEEAVRKRFPEHFGNAEPPQRQQRAAPAVNPPNTRNARPAPREKGIGDLPADARKAGEDFVRRGRVKDLAEYAKLYFEENA